MIDLDQPSLHNSLLVNVSSKVDGTVLDRSLGVHAASVMKNRHAFCNQIGVAYEDVVYQRIIYSDKATYQLIAEVDQRTTTAHTAETVADALFTRTRGVGLFLPVADCVATVIYDPEQKLLALLHLGRHSTLTNLLPRMVQKFKNEGSAPEDLIVWMSPSAQRSTYRLDHFALKHEPAWQPFCDEKKDGIYIDMQGYNRQRCLDNGILTSNIHASSVNTMEDENYFSHAVGDTHGRMAVLAMIR